MSQKRSLRERRAHKRTCTRCEATTDSADSLRSGVLSRRPARLILNLINT
jgi:hypothetical protein